MGAPVAIWLSSAGLVGCGDDGNSIPNFTRQDSAGVVITTSAAGAWTSDEAWLVAANPSVTMGGSEPGEELLRVRDYARAADGSVAVLSAGLTEVRVFNSAGASLRVVGRKGEGPGEYMSPRSIALAGPDTLLVLDRDAIEVFLLDGTWLMSIPLNWAPNPFGVGTATEPAIVAPDRSILASVRRSTVGMRRPVGVFRPDRGFAVFPAPDQPPVLLGWYGGIEQERLDVGGTTRSIVSPFARSTVRGVGISSDERFFVADNARYEVQVFDAQGALRRVVRREDQPVVVQAEWIEEWKDAQRDMDWTQGQLAQLERGWAQMTVRETLPALEMAAFDSEGYLWVLRASGIQGADDRFDIFSPEGRYLGEVRVPAGLRTFPRPLIGESVFIGVWTDELEVETVRVHALRRGG